MAIETSTPFRRVVGTLIRGVGNGPNGAVKGLPVPGAVMEFTASIRHAATDALIVFDPVHGITDGDAKIIHSTTGELGVPLIVTDNPVVGAVDWTWHVKITAESLPFPVEFDIPVPSGVGDIDLSGLDPIPGGDGQVLYVWKDSVAAVAAAAAEAAIEGLNIVTADKAPVVTWLNWSTPTVDYVGDTVEANVGRAVAQSVPNQSTVPHVGLSGKIDDSVIPDTVMRSAGANTFYGRQTFDPTEGITMGDVRLKFLNAHGGNRFTLEAAPDAPNSMPYFDVYASTAYPNYSSGDDVGGATGGYQIHVEGRAGEVNRAYWHTEAHADSYVINGDEATRGYVSMGMAKRGTGRIRSFVLLAGTQKALDLHPDGNVHLGNFSSFVSETPDGFTDNRATPIRMSRRGGVGTLAVTTSSSESADGNWGYPFARLSRLHSDTFAGAAGGAGAAKSGDTLGAFQAGSGSHQRDAPRIGGDVRFKATEDWGLDTARGTAAEVTYTPKGTTARQTAARFEEGTAGQTSMLVQVNRDGTRSMSRVEVGPPDSAGPGFRSLRVAN